jgi:hypothetical protein
MPQIFWGSPHKHVPVIDGIQFRFHGAYTDKATADRIANYQRKTGVLARVQKKPLNRQRGERIVGYCYVVFVASPKKWRN